MKKISNFIKKDLKRNLILLFVLGFSFSIFTNFKTLLLINYKNDDNFSRGAFASPKINKKNLKKEINNKNQNEKMINDQSIISKSVLQNKIKKIEEKLMELRNWFEKIKEEETINKETSIKNLWRWDEYIKKQFKLKENLIKLKNYSEPKINKIKFSVVKNLNKNVGNISFTEFEIQKDEKSGIVLYITIPILTFVLITIITFFILQKKIKDLKKIKKPIKKRIK